MKINTRLGDIFINNDQDKEIIREILDENRYSIDERIKLEGRVLDIGAHIGIFSKLALSKGCSVTSVEPEEKNFNLLKVNAKGATLINKAVTFKKEAFLNVHPDRGEMHRLAESGVKVETISLDDLIDGEIDLLKMDIEGGEYDAFKGCTKLGMIKQITMEYHLGINRVAELIRDLEAFGFDAIYIEGERFGTLQLKRL